MRKVFFSFHFASDSFKVGQIRNSWLGNPSHDSQPYLDKAEWEKIERQGGTSIQNWIDSQIRGTSVTVVLIGSQTLQRPWVKYEMAKTIERKAGLLGISLYGMTNIDKTVDYGKPSYAGSPFVSQVFGSPAYKVYNWVSDAGRQNLSQWIEEAARSAGR